MPEQVDDRRAERMLPVVDVRVRQAAERDWAMRAGTLWNDAQALLDHLTRNTNQVAAAQAFPWERYLAAGAVVLDLGCGSGWLTALLTRRQAVREVIAWDGSFGLLEALVPTMVSLLEGDEAKVRRICGGFAPLTLDAACVDVVVMCSAFHHAPDPDAVLDECARVLRPGGTLVLLNEVPYARLSLLRFVAATAVAAAVNGSTSHLTLEKRGFVAATRILYDEQLGDHALTAPQWHRLFRRHRLAVEVIDSGLPSYPSTYRRRSVLERNLTHFVARPL